MVTMVDEIFDRGYRAARSELNSSISDAFAGIARTLGDSLKVLHRLEWGAPWNSSKEPARRA
jgi:hypothetical protein